MANRINIDLGVRDLMEVLKGDEQNISDVHEKAYI